MTCISMFQAPFQHRGNANGVMCHCWSLHTCFLILLGGRLIQVWDTSAGKFKMWVVGSHALYFWPFWSAGHVFPFIHKGKNEEHLITFLASQIIGSDMSGYPHLPGSWSVFHPDCFSENILAICSHSDTLPFLKDNFILRRVSQWSPCLGLFLTCQWPDWREWSWSGWMGTWGHSKGATIDCCPFHCGCLTMCVFWFVVGCRLQEHLKTRAYKGGTQGVWDTL